MTDASLDTVIDTSGIPDELLKLAKLQKELDDTQSAITELKAKYIDPLDKQANDLKKLILESENTVKKIAREYALSTGDFNVSNHIEIKRKPVTWMYDEAEIIEAAKKNKATELIRVTEELNKTNLNKALKDDKYSWLQAEAVKDIIISIRPLGELLIMLDSKNKDNKDK